MRSVNECLIDLVSYSEKVLIAVGLLTLAGCDKDFVASTPQLPGIQFR
jgi:hypothetical protein